MAKGIKRKIKIVMKNVQNQIRIATDQDSLFSRGLSREGYDGGYEAALSDVMLALNGVKPCNRPNFWPEFWKEDK